jgi:hypothetical protein
MGSDRGCGNVVRATQHVRVQSPHALIDPRCMDSFYRRASAQSLVGEYPEVIDSILYRFELIMREDWL